MLTGQLPLRRWTLEEFERMSEVGLVSPGGYELLDGVIYDTNGYLRRWSVRDLDVMAEVGLITQDERAELVEGCVLRPRGFKWVRARIRMRLNRFLHDAVGAFGIVNQVGHVALDDETVVHSATDVLRYRDDFYEERYPNAGDVLLLIEVADQLASHYLEVKRGLYARHGIAEYWKLDPRRRSVVVHLAPDEGGFRHVREYMGDASFVSPALDGREIRVEDVLGPAARETEERSDD